MSTTSYDASPGTTLPVTMFDRAARGQVVDQLVNLAGGTLTLHDFAGTLRLGSSGPLAAEITVHRPRLYRRLATGGSLAAGEAWVDGDWSCTDLTALIRLLLRNKSTADAMDGGLATVARWAQRAISRLFPNTRRASRRNIAAHYDLGNEVFRLFLDETLMYSSAIFPAEESTLYEASLEKLGRICRQLDLQPGDHVLEIGTGWGGFALHAATNYGCRVTTTTISREQFGLAQERIETAGLSSRIEVLERDYRDLDGRFDKLVSIEMIEAVGHKYFDVYFRQCSRLLKPDGLMLLQSIVMNEQGYEAYLRSVDFIQKHVFPGGCLPSVTAIAGSVARATDMRLVHLTDYAAHYARTLRCWRERFFGSIDEVRRLGYSDDFIRLWDYYLCYCEAAFEERWTGLVQMLFEKPQSRHDRRPWQP